MQRLSARFIGGEQARKTRRKAKVYAVETTAGCRLVVEPDTVTPVEHRLLDKPMKAKR